VNSNSLAVLFVLVPRALFCRAMVRYDARRVGTVFKRATRIGAVSDNPEVIEVKLRVVSPDLSLLKTLSGLGIASSKSS
jgi:hypothetical protein